MDYLEVEITIEHDKKMIEILREILIKELFSIEDIEQCLKDVEETAKTLLKMEREANV